MWHVEVVLFIVTCALCSYLFCSGWRVVVALFQRYSPLYCVIYTLFLPCQGRKQLFVLILKYLSKGIRTDCPLCEGISLGI